MDPPFKCERCAGKTHGGCTRARCTKARCMLARLLQANAAMTTGGAAYAIVTNGYAVAANGSITCYSDSMAGWYRL